MYASRTAVSLLALVLTSNPSQAAGPWRAHAGNSAGWKAMTPDERMEHQRRMRSFGAYEACRRYETEQALRMQQRRAAGDAMGDGEQSACEQLRALGQFK
jgi:hypothetical protein